ncbi:Yos1-like protein [Polychytrium aggregatum]|uniref:Yos1-like protein n=1 Tax=Polychytrium aggregatum TaxID=110093 RepID=UPI0022FE7806|nr:Yos1-like protein [Polychytrium aggregatum]KAI9203766.1 Yos1-like protein [Polychytrium aggregatum]
MAFIGSTFGQLFYAVLLLINAVAVLHEERFLAKVGLGQVQSQNQFDPNSISLRSKVVNLISAVRTLLRFPLIGINVLVIIYELIFG